MTLNSVVLPAPFGPIRPVTVAGSTLIETSSRATLPPKRTLQSMVSSSGMSGALLVVHGRGDRDRHGVEAQRVLHGDAVVVGERPVDADELRRVSVRSIPSFFIA